MSGTTGNESAPDLARGGKLAAREGASAIDGVPRPVVVGSLRLEQRKDAFRAIGCPRRYPSTIFFAERLT
jgi:hypothetical protein